MRIGRGEGRRGRDSRLIPEVWELELLASPRKDTYGREKVIVGGTVVDQSFKDLG